MVGDLEKAKEWYNEVFQSKPYFDEPFYVGYSIGGYELGLQESKDLPSEKTANIHTYWGVDNIQKEFDRLLELGATSFEEPYNVGGEIMVATVKDPWDNLIGIIYNPDFKAEG